MNNKDWNIWAVKSNCPHVNIPRLYVLMFLEKSRGFPGGDNNAPLLALTETELGGGEL